MSQVRILLPGPYLAQRTQNHDVISAGAKRCDAAGIPSNATERVMSTSNAPTEKTDTTPSNHTEGVLEVQPLQSSLGADIALVSPDNGYVVAVIQFDPSIQEHDEPDADTVIRQPFDEPNARRLAACWNACMGIPTELLESLEPGELDAAVNDPDRDPSHPMLGR
jgi:hypothetical protein